MLQYIRSSLTGMKQVEGLTNDSEGIIFGELKLSADIHLPHNNNSEWVRHRFECSSLHFCNNALFNLENTILLNQTIYSCEKNKFKLKRFIAFMHCCMCCCAIRRVCSSQSKKVSQYKIVNIPWVPSIPWPWRQKRFEVGRLNRSSFQYPCQYRWRWASLRGS